MRRPITLERQVEKLKHPNPEVRSNALRRIHIHGGPQAVTMLIEALHDPEEGIRGYAAYALGQIEAAEAVPVLIDRLQTDPAGRALYAHTLAQIGGPGVVEALIALLGDTGEFVAQFACSGLAQLGDRRAVEPLLKVLREHELRAARQEACTALIHLGVTGEQIETALERLIQEAEAQKDERAAQLMRWELAELRNATDLERRRFIDAAMENLHHPDRQTRCCAVSDIRGGANEPRVEAALLAAMEDPEWSVRSIAASGLSSVEASKAVPVLIKHLLGDESPEVRSECARCLGKHRDPSGVEALIQTLSDPDPMLVEMSAFSLGDIGDSRAIPPLIQLLDHPKWDVGFNAAWALLQLKAADERLVEALDRLARERKAREHDLMVGEWNAALEPDRRKARERGEPEPTPSRTFADLVEQARQLLRQSEP